MTKAVQRDGRQTQPTNERTVCMIEAGGRYVVDVAGQLTSLAKPGEQLRRQRYRTDRRLALGERVDDLAGIQPVTLVYDLELFSIEIDVLPLQAADFSASHPQHERQRERETVRMIVQRGHIGRDLIVRPRDRRALDVRGAGDALHGELRQVGQRRRQQHVAEFRRPGMAGCGDLRQAWPNMQRAEILDGDLTDRRHDVQAKQ